MKNAISILRFERNGKKIEPNHTAGNTICANLEIIVIIINLCPADGVCSRRDIFLTARTRKVLVPSTNNYMRKIIRARDGELNSFVTIKVLLTAHQLHIS